MDTKWKETFRLYAQLEEHAKKVQEAETLIANALGKYKQPYVAFSGGKDSTCMLHLVLKQAPEITVFHWDYGRYMPRDFEAETIENMKLLGAKNVVLETSDRYNDLSYNGRVFIPEFFSRIVPQFIAQGYDLAFVGLRRQESCKRNNRIKAKRSISQLKEVWPLQEWSYLDVWAYIIANNLPYHHAYDIYGPSVGWEQVRFTTFFDPEFDKFGCRNLDGYFLWKYRHLAK